MILLVTVTLSVMIHLCSKRRFLFISRKCIKELQTVKDTSLKNLADIEQDLKKNLKKKEYNEKYEKTFKSTGKGKLALER